MARNSPSVENFSSNFWLPRSRRTPHRGGKETNKIKTAAIDSFSFRANWEGVRLTWCFPFIHQRRPRCQQPTPSTRIIYRNELLNSGRDPSAGGRVMNTKNALTHLGLKHTRLMTTHTEHSTAQHTHTKNATKEFCQFRATEIRLLCLGVCNDNRHRRWHHINNVIERCSAVLFKICRIIDLVLGDGYKLKKK